MERRKRAVLPKTSLNGTNDNNSNGHGGDHNGNLATRYVVTGWFADNAGHKIRARWLDSHVHLADYLEADLCGQRIRLSCGYVPVAHIRLCDLEDVEATETVFSADVGFGGGLFFLEREEPTPR
jgi:hypothetical protein